MHRDLADGLAAGSVAVWANGRINGKCGITHRRRLLCRWKVLHPFPGSKSYLFQTYSTSKCVSLFKLSDLLPVDVGYIRVILLWAALKDSGLFHFSSFRF